MLALAFLALFAIWITALLGLGYANLKNTLAVRQTERNTYEAEAAVNGALAWLRLNTDKCTVGNPTIANVFTYNGATVRCTFTGNPHELYFDRPIDLVVSRSGRDVLTAKVIIRDTQTRTSSPVPVGEQSADIVSFSGAS